MKHFQLLQIHFSLDELLTYILYLINENECNNLYL
jgi:hypothetical protein